MVLQRLEVYLVGVEALKDDIMIAVSWVSWGSWHMSSVQNSSWLMISLGDYHDPFTTQIMGISQSKNRKTMETHPINQPVYRVLTIPGYRMQLRCRLHRCTSKFSLKAIH